MAIRSFRIEQVRGLVSAWYDDLPDLVVIAGGNGTGKSTLLDQLFRRRHEFSEAGTQVLYLGPSRTQRRGAVTAGGVLALQQDLLSGLSLEHGPSFQNFTPQEFAASSGQPRGLEGIDDSYSLVKYEIQRLETQRREALAQLHDRDGQVLPGAIPDVYEPLRALTRYLLPHLTFVRVDQTNPNSLRCLFARVDGSTRVEVELDDLSSGEKAVIALFMPFLALQIRRSLRDLGVNLHQAEDFSSVTALIDEPEIHLHPALQGHLAHYLRQVSSETGAQFILATHSPTLVDAAGEDELFVLMPSEFVGGGNQFRQLLTQADRLDVVRELVGSASLITRARPIVFVEGETVSSKVDSDAGLLSILVPESVSWVIVPARGRTEALRSARQLHDQLAEELPGLPVFALVDADSSPPDDERMIAWPVAMIENLLLDPQAIAAILNPLALPALDPTLAGVQTLLDSIVIEQRDDEVRLRVERGMGVITTRARFRDGMVSVDEVTADVDAYRARVTDSASSVIENAEAEVGAILREGRGLELFRGKQILDQFFARAALSGQFSKASFKIQLAREASRHVRLKRLTTDAVARIMFFLPRELLSDLESIPEHIPGTDDVLASAHRARAAMEGGSTDGIDMDALRGQIRDIVGQLDLSGQIELSARLRSKIPLIGLGS